MCGGCNTSEGTVFDFVKHRNNTNQELMLYCIKMIKFAPILVSGHDSCSYSCFNKIMKEFPTLWVTPINHNGYIPSSLKLYSYVHA